MESNVVEKVQLALHRIELEFGGRDVLVHNGEILAAALNVTCSALALVLCMGVNLDRIVHGHEVGSSNAGPSKTFPKTGGGVGYHDLLAGRKAVKDASATAIR
jgi:hypothetical protein